MSIVKHVTSQEFAADVLQSPIPVLVDFYADWCGPCRMLAPALEAVAGEFAGRVKVVKVNVDDEPGIAGRFGIQSIPTLLAFGDGNLIDRVVGIGSPGQLRQLLTRISGNSRPTTARMG